jgi:hypothetical protein
VISLTPRARGESVRPRRSLGASARPLNFCVSRRVRVSSLFKTLPLDLAANPNAKSRDDHMCQLWKEGAPLGLERSSRSCGCRNWCIRSCRSISGLAMVGGARLTFRSRLWRYRARGRRFPARRVGGVRLAQGHSTSGAQILAMGAGLDSDSSAACVRCNTEITDAG